MTPKIDQLVFEGENVLSGSSDTPRLDAEIIISNILGLSRFDLLLKGKDPVSKEIEEKFRGLINKRKNGVPVAYLTNKKDFFEDTFFVDSRVLVPRPESEFVVMEAVSVLKSCSEPDVLDICCGSGCIGLSVKRVTGCNLVLSDISGDALAVAEINSLQLFPGDRNIRFIKSDLFNEIEGKFDVITANPPYLSDKDMSEYVQGSLEFEPRNALYGGFEGIEVTNRVILEASEYLKPHGVVIIELGYEGSKKLLSCYENIKLDTIIKDYSGIERVAVFSLHR
jgi:release factor glutamine methyltransferase